MTAATPGPIVVAAVVDESYAMPLAVTLSSAVTNLQRGRSLDIWLVDAGISDQSRARLRGSMPEERASIHWLAPAAARIGELPLWGRMSINTYERLLVGEHLPKSVQRAIWLDSDLVVLADLGRLWELETSGHHLLAAQDAVVPYVSSPLGIRPYREIGLDADDEYFNAGVMLVDLERWREDEIGRRAIDYLHAYGPHVRLWDQEGLNAVLAGRWGKLDPRWNRTTLGQDAIATGQHVRSNRQGDDSEPWILHFTGNLKPWLIHNRSTSRALYFSYLDQTAWQGWRPRRTLGSRLLGTFASSPLRRFASPLEKCTMRCWRAWTLETTPAPSNTVLSESQER
jgi:lipopolysaccharide biosynthesis glycosyltransferase